MKSKFACLAIALVVGLAACSARVCTGGARSIGSQCECARGTVWNGNECQGTPQSGACAPTLYQFGDQCLCLDGFVSDGRQCVKLNCTNGFTVSVNQCVCAKGKHVIQGRCQVRCPEGATRIDDDHCSCPAGAVVEGKKCVCPAGTSWDNTQCAPLNCTGGSVISGNQCVCPTGREVLEGRCVASCIEGAVRVDDDNCACPENAVVADGACRCVEGMQWNGAACIAVAAPVVEEVPAPAPAGEEGERREHRRRGERRPDCRAVAIAKGFPPSSLDYCEGAEPRCAEALINHGYPMSSVPECRGVDAACALAVIEKGYPPSSLSSCRGGR